MISKSILKIAWRGYRKNKADIWNKAITK